MAKNKDDFDLILDDLGGLGKYQKRLLYGVLGPVFFIMPFAFLTQIFVVHSPTHWCKTQDEIHHSSLGIDLDKWKSIFLPLEESPYAPLVPSSCQMYNFTEDQLAAIKENEEFFTNSNYSEVASFASGLQGNTTPTMGCTGWSYDDSEFTSTAVTDNDWVCDKRSRPSDLLTIGIAGLIIGIFVFSAVSDFSGRKLVFYIGTIIVMVFNLVMIPVSHIYPLFAFFKFVSSFGMMPLFQSPMNILCEISNINDRGFIIGYSCIMWSFGSLAVPLIGYLIPDWKILTAISMAPFIFIFFSWKILPESPRWLIARGRVNEATDILRKVSEANNVVAPSNLGERVNTVADNVKTKSLGYISLFSSPKLAMRTIIMTMAFTSSAFVYYQMVINVSNMWGNTFMNMFLLGLVEAPGYVLGVVMADKLGRRWTHFSLLAMNSVLFMAIIPVVALSGMEDRWWSTPVTAFFCMFIKFNISASFVVAYVQAMEIFPTCIRQSGIGFCTLISQIISIGGPHVIGLGEINLAIPYLVMFGICALGAIGTIFLPETNGRPLPETMEDAQNLGRGDSFCSWIPTGYQAPKEQRNIYNGTS